MNCLNADQLTSFLDGALERAEYERISAHLEQCGRCRSECEHIRQEINGINELFRRRRPVEVPDVSLLMQAPKRRNSARWRPLAIAASILMTALAIAYILSIGESYRRDRDRSPTGVTTDTAEPGFRIHHLNVMGAAAESFTFQESGDRTTYVWAAVSDDKSDRPGGSV